MIKVKTPMWDFEVDKKYLHTTIENIKQNPDSPVMFDRYGKNINSYVDYFFKVHDGDVYNDTISFFDELLTSFKEYDEKPKDTVNEFWVDLRGYEDLYLLSNFGRVKNKRTDKIRKPQLTTNGYYNLTLNKDCVTKTHYVHRFVADQFCLKGDNTYVYHIDELELLHGFHEHRHLFFGDV